MGLRLKFNILLIFTFLIGISIAGVIAYKILEQNAEEEVNQLAGVMMSSANAMRQYTIRQIKPLLVAQQKQSETFYPQTVPAYAATQTVGIMQKKFKEYREFSYKEATINPTNPDNRASSWEEDIIRWFRNQPATVAPKRGIRQTPNGPYMYLSSPIRITNQACLGCHGHPDNAPLAMKAKYGSVNGFGWKINQVVGAQIVSVPMTVPFARAQKTFATFMGSLIGVFIFVAFLLNIFLNTFIIKRIKRMSSIANDISLGTGQSKEFVIKGTDEVASLAKSFNRMRRSLTSAMDMLEETTGNFTRLQ